MIRETVAQAIQQHQTTSKANKSINKSLLRLSKQVDQLQLALN
jgi:hypothetical protein